MARRPLLRVLEGRIRILLLVPVVIMVRVPQHQAASLNLHFRPLFLWYVSQDRIPAFF